MSDKQTVTSDDLVRAIRQENGQYVVDLAVKCGYSLLDAAEKGYDVATRHGLMIHYIASRITLPAPTTTGTLNGQPARFEIVYRGNEA